MSDVYSLFEQEAADPQAFNKVREGDTKDLSSLIRRSVDLDQQIKDTEAQLKDLKDKKRAVDEEDIPSIMQTMGVESLQVDGNKVTVDKFVSARIPETKKQEAADPQAFKQVREGDTKNLSSLIRRSVELDQQIKDTEAQLKDLQQKKRSVDEEDIPSLMETMGVESLTVDGNKVSIDKFVSARIPETRKQEAFQYLREVGEGDLIKNEVVVSFSMGQDNQAGSVVADLENKGFAPVKKQHVHPMTLKTWVKNRIESGKEIDFDLFGVYQGNRAKIKGGQ